MQITISKIKQLVLALMLLTANVTYAYATDMSALDFNGDLIGKVIPDGSVINPQNELIGHITADGFVVNEDNTIIGGMVPQGVAVSVDNSILGKINNDGSVTTASDSIVGKVLPNGLIVDINYNILGAVIATGLVYDDTGSIVGRITGDGQFYNLSGQNGGFVTTSGHVYTTLGSDKKAELAGKVISSKMVVASNGKFLGSITPDGKVIDLKKNIVGTIHANGFVYNAEGVAIGHLVQRGYAFSFNGSYLGVISYNGEVVDKGATVAYTSLKNKVISKDGKYIGFTVDISATANTLDGKYLGYITDNGQVTKGRTVVGKIGASGDVIDPTGNVIGVINQIGPVFDYLGETQANAAVNGAVISLNGVEQGYTIKERAYDYKGKEIGQLMGDKLNFDNSNNFIGLSGIKTSLVHQGKSYKISPYGYVFDEQGNLSGKNYELTNIYAPDGSVLAGVSANGKPDNITLSEKSKLTSTGFLISSENKLLGKSIAPQYATDFRGKNLGYINPNNQVVDLQNNIYAQILPDGSILSEKEAQYLGVAGDAPFSISINGDYLGTNKINGEVKKADEVIGHISSSKYVVDNMGALYGKTLSYGAIISSNCKFVGVVSDNGDARTATNNYLGTVLANNQVVDDNEEVIGFVVQPSAVSGKKGEIIGVETPLGTVLNYNNQNLGCQDISKKIRNTQKEIVGHVVTNLPVVSFDNQIIGQTNFHGLISDSSGNEIGYVDIDGGAYSTAGEDIGNLFEYKIAFTDDNVYLGQVNSEAKVIDESGATIGSVNHDGKVVLNNGQSGYALNDLYIYDNDEKTIGYIAKNGRVYSIMGDLKGAIHKGFCLDKKQNLIGRGSRDYYIRDAKRKIIGYLNLDGKVINNRNIEVGQLKDNGDIIDNSGNVIAQANPLQYYQKEAVFEEEPEVVPEEQPKEDIETIPEVEETADVEEDTPIETEPEDEEEDESLDQSSVGEPAAKIQGVAVSSSGQYIGQVNENNEVIDENGNVIGYVNENGEIVDKDGNVIGMFKGQPAEKSQAANSKWFHDIIKGVTVSPYDDTNNVSNVGAGGGIGPGGRYNPRRAAILSRLYEDRRKSLTGKRIGNTSDMSAYTGWQDDWGDVANVGKSISTLRVNMDNMIASDKPIPAVMARTVISLGEAPITAIVERNIYGESGRNVIIPAGSRVIGTWDYSSSEAREDGNSGGVKLELTWRRIIRPDGIAFNISSSETGDAQGRGGGALGYVDEQLLKKYAMPLFGNVATSAIAYMMAANQDATGEVETSKQQAANDARQNFLDKMNEILNKIMDSKEQITAVTYVPAGTRIIIYPMSDLWLRTTKNIEKGEVGEVEHDNSTFVDDAQAERDNANQGAHNQGGGGQQPMNNDAGGGGNPQNQGQPGQGNMNTALPPPSADGSGAIQPEENKDEMELDF